LTWYNNIVLNQSGGTALNFSNTPVVMDYDCYLGASESGASGTVDTHSLLSTNPQFASTITPGAGATQFQLATGSPCIGAGRVGGVASGTACNIGAWDGTVTQIGASFTSGAGSSPPPAVPNPPVLTVS